VSPHRRTAPLTFFPKDMMERWTNGVLAATEHRVGKPPHERFSIVRFNGVASKTVVEPLPHFGAPKYPPTTMGGHMKAIYDRLDEGQGSEGSRNFEGQEWRTGAGGAL
jgi:isopenicillin N synthase-like dioxygenase